MSKSKKNKSIREELEQIYGKKCMYHEGIRTVRPPQPSKKKYTGKKIQEQLTLHHLIPVNRYKARGIHGETTVENGALLCRYCHTYIEALPDEEREKINDELRKYKREHSKECEVEYVDNLDLDFHINAFVFTPDQIKPKKQYNRTKKKKEDQKIIEEWEERNDE